MKNELYIHAYDISLSSSGVTIFSDEGEWIETTCIKTNSNDTHGIRLRTIGNRVLEIRKKYPCSVLICEQGFSRFSTSTQAIFKTNGVISYLYYDVEQIFYPPATVKKIITTRGNAKKDEVANILKLNYPDISYQNDDESDSFAVAITYLLKNEIIKKWKN